MWYIRYYSQDFPSAARASLDLCWCSFYPLPGVQAPKAVVIEEKDVQGFNHSIPGPFEAYRSSSLWKLRKSAVVCLVVTRVEEGNEGEE